MSDKNLLRAFYIFDILIALTILIANTTLYPRENHLLLFGISYMAGRLVSHSIYNLNKGD